MAKYPRDSRLLAAADFVKVFKANKRFHSHGFLIFARSNELGHPRLGLAIKRNVANSVGRNRIKRLTREKFRCAFPRIGIDIVVIAKPGIAASSNDDINQLLECQWKKLNKYFQQQQSLQSNCINT